MENMNEGSVTISLHRYKELEGYEKDFLNSIAEIEASYKTEVEGLKNRVEVEEGRYNRVKALLDEYEPLIINSEKTLREAILLNEEKANDFRKKMMDNNTKLREEFEGEKNNLISKHELHLREYSYRIGEVEQSAQKLAAVMTLVGIAVGFLFGILLMYNLK